MWHSSFFILPSLIFIAHYECHHFQMLPNFAVSQSWKAEHNIVGDAKKTLKAKCQLC